MPSSLRLAFAGTPEFAVPALKALCEAGHEVALVLTQPDRPAGRGQKLKPSPVKSSALEYGLRVETPASLKSTRAQNLIADAHPDLMVVVAYGQILPRTVLDIPIHGCWNIHASLLPRWRGAAPIHRAIQAGDTVTGVCIMQMDAGLDTGDILACTRLAIPGRATTGDLHDRLAMLGAQTLMPLVHELAATGRPPEPMAQPDAGVTYAHKLDKAEAELDWRESAETLDRIIRAFNPWPVAWSVLSGEGGQHAENNADRWRIWSAEPAGPTRAQPGQVLISGDDAVYVGCGDGRSLRLIEVQKPGGTPVPAGALARGGQLSSRQTFRVPDS